MSDPQFNKPILNNNEFPSAEDLNLSPSPNSHHIRRDSIISFKYDREIEFYLLLIGFTIGYGSFWRFPYLIYSNGGGTFLVPYFIFLLIVGIPAFYLECYYGQIFNKDPVSLFESVSNKWAGVGWAMVAMSWMLSLYYGTILCWSTYYFFESFISPLPWSNVGKVDSTTGEPLPYMNADYFRHSILRITEGIENMGSLDFYKVLCLIISYIMIYFCIAKGPQTSSKVVYFTAPAPVILLIVLFFKGLLYLVLLLE